MLSAGKRAAGRQGRADGAAFLPWQCAKTKNDTDLSASHEFMRLPVLSPPTPPTFPHFSASDAAPQLCPLCQLIHPSHTSPGCSQAPSTMHHILAILLLWSCCLATGFSDASASPASCAALSATSAVDYWDSVASCAPCLAAGCTFSLSSLLCVTEDLNASPEELLQGAPAQCPVPPPCGDFPSCDSCLAQGPDCAWCGREGLCLLSSKAHSGEVPCTAVQYQQPCKPSSERECVCVCVCVQPEEASKRCCI